MKVGIVQHSFSEDVDANRTRNLNAIESLASEGADLVVLSELHDFAKQKMWIISYMPRAYREISPQSIVRRHVTTMLYW